MNIEIPEDVLLGKFNVTYDKIGDKKLESWFFNYVVIDDKKVIVVYANFTDSDLKRLETEYDDVICNIDDVVTEVRKSKHKVVRVLYNDLQKAFEAWLKLNTENL